MIPGRFIGIFCAAVLASFFRADNLLAQLILWIAITLISFLISIAVSLLIGININTEQPNYMDSQEYWTDKYGEEMGKEMYKMWLEEI